METFPGRTRQQATMTLASTCPCPHVTPFGGEAHNMSPSAAATCCCQSTPCRGCLTRGDLVVDAPKQLFGTAEQNTAGQWFHPPQGFLHHHAFLLSLLLTQRQHRKARVLPRPPRRLSQQRKGLQSKIMMHY